MKVYLAYRYEYTQRVLARVFLDKESADAYLLAGAGVDA